MPAARALHDTPERVEAKKRHAALQARVNAKARAKSKAARAQKIRQNGLSIDQVNLAVLAARGNLHQAAADLGVSRGTLNHFVKNHNDCAAVLKEAREVMGDIAESKLHELIEQGDVRCIMYYLSTVHRARGYGVRKDDAPAPADHSPTLTINVVAVPSGRFLSKSEAANQLTIDHVPSQPTPIDPLS